MSTREQILDALTANPAGLTTKELTPHCSDCEHDEQIVGRIVAQLRSEGVIHPGNQLRAGGTIWLLGAEEEQRVNETVLSMNAARTDSAVSIGWPNPSTAGRAATPSTGPARAPAPAVRQQKDIPLPVLERVRQALTEHGPMTVSELRRYVTDNGTLSAKLSYYKSCGMLDRLGGATRATVYGLPGQTLKDRKINNVPRKSAAPVPPAKPAGGGFMDAIAALMEKRTSLAMELEQIEKRKFEIAEETGKVDNAIAALEELA